MGFNRVLMRSPLRFVLARLQRASMGPSAGGATLPWALLVTILNACHSPKDSSVALVVDWQVDGTPTFEVGGHDNRPAYLLNEVVGAARLQDGRVVVANQVSAELKFFGPSGDHLMTVGGEGDGPGEMRYLHQMMRLAGDTLVVLSSGPGLTWFGPDGSYLRSRRIDMFSRTEIACRYGEGGWRILPDGSLLTVLHDNFGAPGCAAVPDGIWRMSGLVVRRTGDPEIIDTIGLFAESERIGSNFRNFGHALFLGLADDRIYAGDTGADAILAVSLAGDTLLEIPNPFAAAPVPSGIRSERRVLRPDGTTRLEPSSLPAEYPPYGRLVVDRLGDLWVMEYPRLTVPIASDNLAAVHRAFTIQEGGSRWRVFGPDGVMRGEVRTPPAFFLLEAGADYVLGVTRDEFDVETVAVHRLTR